MTSRLVLVLFIVAAAMQMAQARKLLQHEEDQKATWRANVKDETQGSAWTNSKGNDPGGPGDAFTWRQAEASAASQFNGIYYNAGKKVVEAGDRAKGSWVGTYITHHTDMTTVNPIAATLDAEYSFNKGTTAIAGTAEGARAVAGSGGSFGLSHDPAAAATWTIDAYGPSRQDNIMTGGVRDYNWQRSAAQTDIAPTSVAQAGTGNGPAAVSSGFEVASVARAYKDKKVPTTVGHREAGDALQARLGFDPAARTTQGRKARKQLLSVFQNGMDQLSQLTSSTRSASHRRSLLLRGKPLVAAQ